MATLFLLVLLFGAVILYFAFLADLFLGGISALPTSPRALARSIHILKEKGFESGILLDIGSAHGLAALAFARAFPDATVVGIESSRMRFCIAYLRGFLTRSRARFIYADAFAYPVDTVGAVYCYLPWSIMPQLEKKLRAELPPGAIVIANTTKFPAWKPEAEEIVWPENPNFELLSVYRK